MSNYKLNNFNVLKNKFLKNPTLLQNEDENSYRDNRQLMIELVKSKGYILQYASSRLKADHEVVFEAINTNGSALAYTSAELKNDKSIVLIAISKFGQALAFASPRLQDDEEVVFEAVKRDGSALRFANIRLHSHHTFLMYYVRALKTRYKDINLVISKLKNNYHTPLLIEPSQLKEYWSLV